jgi:hypothetical protein
LRCSANLQTLLHAVRLLPCLHLGIFFENKRSPFSPWYPMEEWESDDCISSFNHLSSSTGGEAMWATRKAMT